MTEDNRSHFNQEYLRTYDGSGDLRFFLYSPSTRRWIFEELPKLSVKVLMDLGAGDSWLLHKVASFLNAPHLIVAVDMSDASLMRCASRVTNGNSNHEISSVQADVCHLPFKAGWFDFVISTMVMEHVDDHRFLKGIREILVPGGIALVTTVVKKPWAWYYLKDSSGKSILELTHLREYGSLDELIGLVQGHGFQVLKASLAPIRFSLLTPLFKWMVRMTGSHWWHQFPATTMGIWIRLLSRIPVPGYYSAEIIFQNPRIKKGSSPESVGQNDTL